ncbi:hypothetical protein [uncultured Christiangramia sp.]|uniref:hypothetical protein n=1 Tax=uncultured Christiangramia sp. TaxID=503836 RepID=UPI0026227D73|nr:hypothetical protein [uncultured Christiangramia sp.]
MRKLFIMLAFLGLSCSNDESENQDEEVCCDTTVSAIIADYDRLYGEILSKPDITEQQRIEAEAEYRRRRENPCESYKRYVLEANGAPCSANP